MDTIDQNILDMLRQNSRIPVNELAMQVHLTPPAVSARIKKLQADGTIRSFTIQLNDEIENKGTTAYITLFMKCSRHQELRRFIRENLLIQKAHQISGHGCYLLKLVYLEHQQLLTLLDALSRFGTHQLDISIDKIK
ncbi:Lrp/AsnC family transcriptional regulator [Megasphaera cerevisiae]|uniref:Lrp/AsnC family transcriptional regulator n=1 Tax=Megasphaera cerevisiae TaxID=39029 RepID=UPI0009FB2268|nr:Lrp/AsnC family transcriptional regulator [Megasphaera cerevisiae]